MGAISPTKMEGSIIARKPFATNKGFHLMCVSVRSTKAAEEAGLVIT